MIGAMELICQAVSEDSGMVDQVDCSEFEGTKCNIIENGYWHV